jgi:hypothetical protein
VRAHSKLLLAGVAVLASACAQRAGQPPRAPGGAAAGSAAPAPFTLEFVAAAVIPSGTAFDALGARPIGGLSGVTPGADHDTFLAISDEKAQPRLLAFALQVRAPTLVVSPVRAFVIEADGLEAGGRLAPDFEGVARRADGHWFVSSEGDGDRRPRIAPAILEFDASNRFLRTLPLPDRFRPTRRGSLVSGTRPNQAFESLAMSADGERLFTATEGALVQDGPSPSFGRAGLARLLELVRSGDSYRPGREFAYPLDPIQAPEGYLDPRGDNGLVELAHLGGDTLLAMERSFVLEQAAGRRSATSIRLFRVDLDGADDVSRVRSLARRADVRVLSKTLVLDLASLAAELPDGLTGLDNFEGLCLGPTLADGSRSLLLVSDDNFSASQVTAFVLLRMKDAPDR